MVEYSPETNEWVMHIINNNSLNSEDLRSYLPIKASFSKEDNLNSKAESIVWTTNDNDIFKEMDRSWSGECLIYGNCVDNTLSIHLYWGRSGNCTETEMIEDSTCGEVSFTSLIDYYEDFKYAEGEDSVNIIGYRGNSSSVVIPGKINGKNVVHIRQDSFSSDSIRTITIPNTIQSLDYNSYRGIGVFTNCNNLEKVIFEEGIKRIPAGAF